MHEKHDTDINKLNHIFNSSGFPTGVANIRGGGSSKFDGGRGVGLSQNMGGAWGELKTSSKNTSEGVYLIVKLSAISLQASKFTKNELVNTYFSRIFARFSVIIYCAFSRNHFMEGCFNFQWGGLFFRWGRASFLSGVSAPGGSSVLVGKWFREKL